MAGGDGADRQLIEPVDDGFHLAGHRCHQAVVEPAAVLLHPAAVALGPGLAAEVGGEELATHQQAGVLLEGDQGAGPAGGGGRQQAEAMAAAQVAAHLVLDDVDRRQGRRWRRWRLAGGWWSLLAPELLQQPGAGVGGHQHQGGPAPRQLPQQRHPVGVHVAHHHLEGGIGRHPRRQFCQEGGREGGAGGMHEHRRHRPALAIGSGRKEEAVGGGAPLQPVLHLKAQPFRAQAPQADQAGIHRQDDDPPFALGGWCAHGISGAGGAGRHISNGCPPCGGARRCWRWCRPHCPVPPRRR